MVIQPTLVIGIGGIGGRILSAVSKRLSPEDRKLVATVLLDTNMLDLETAMKSGKVDYAVQISENYVVGEYLKILKDRGEDPDQWFHNIPIINESSLLEGASQVRQKSRLALLAAKKSGKLNSIVNAIDSVNAAFTNGDMQSPINIYIVGSIAGGTCAGAMVQMPYIIRQLMKERGINKATKVKGLFIGPTVTLGYQDGMTEKIRDTFANAYACIKELNGLYHYSSVDRNKIPLKLECYEPHKSAQNSGVNPVPYDYVFLIEKYGMNGQALCPGASPRDYEAMAVNILQAQLSQIGSTAAGAEDNLLSLQIDTAGMAKFCGSGAFTAEYPLEGISDYVALRCAADNIGSQWRRIDEDFKREQRLRNQRMAENANEEPLEFESFYIRKFEEYSAKDSSDRFFKSLGHELQLVKTERNDQTKAKKSLSTEKAGSDANNVIDDAYKAIQTLVRNDALGNSVVKKARNACGMSQNDLKEMITADKSVDIILSDVRSYIEAARDCLGLAYDTSAKIMSIENIGRDEGVSPAWLSNRNSHNIFMSIREKHPIVARYILLKLRAYMMTDLAEDLETEHEMEKSLYIFEERDFDDVKEGNQSAEEALRDILKGSSSKFGFFSKSKTQSMDDFAETFSTVLTEQNAVIEKYLLAAYRKRVFQDVLNKLSILIKTYDLMFDSLPSVVNDISNNVQKIENAHSSDNENVCRYVFARAEHKKVIYQIMKVSADTEKLSDKTKSTFAESLYGLFTGHYYSSVNANTQLKRKQEERLANSTRKLFESKILPDIKADNTITVKKYFDKGIINALRLEAVCDELLRLLGGDLESVAYDLKDQLESGEAIELTDDQENGLREMIKNEVINKAGPFISVEQTNPRESLFWGVNPDVECFGVSKGYVDSLLKPSIGLIVRDTSFSKNKLICYRLLYGAQAHELNAYRNTSEAYKHYRSKVMDVVIDQQKNGLKKDGIDTAFSPHLNKYWHKEFYLPELDPEIETENRFNDLVAVSWLLASEKVFLKEYDGTARWRSTVFGSSEEIRIENVPAKNTLTDLYKSLAFNPLMKEKVIDAVTAEQENDLQNETDIEKNILSHSIIRMFSGIKVASEADPDGAKPWSVFDLIAELKSSYDEEWYRTAMEDLKKYIMDYCERACTSTGVYGQDQKLYRDMMRSLSACSKAETVRSLELDNPDTLGVR